MKQLTTINESDASELSSVGSTIFEGNCELNQNTCKIMEISVSTTATFYLCRICGLAPYLTTKSERDGGISGCRKSKILNMYSFSLIIGIGKITTKDAHTAKKSVSGYNNTFYFYKNIITKFSPLHLIVLLTYCRGIIYDTQSNQPIR